MKGSVKAYIAEEGGKLLSDVLRMTIARPRKSVSAEPSKQPEEIDVIPVEERMIEIPSDTGERVIISKETTQRELDYRFECVMKHLGGASVLLKEAYERANDEGIGEGTAEKIMEAMSEHSGMEADLEKMLAIPEAKAETDKLLSGIRAFRKAAWEANLPREGGTKEDIHDAMQWNNLLYTEAFAFAKAHPGEECIAEGM